MSEHDYIIVGAGTAGCVLANRLTASGAHSVLLTMSTGRSGACARKSFTTEWQRTKSPIQT